MKQDITINRISDSNLSSSFNSAYTFLLLGEEVKSIKIDGEVYQNIQNSAIFLKAKQNFKLEISKSAQHAGYILEIEEKYFHHSIMNQLHIQNVAVFAEGIIPKIKLSPGIEIRILSILEMIDELLHTNLDHKDSAILSLLNTLFIYCDGKCNIKTEIQDNSSKKQTVYAFKQLMVKHIHEYHEVSNYAELLNISPNYLNTCVQEVLNVSAKYMIIELLMLLSRKKLKFTNLSMKEIAYELGFSSPDYFSAFFKTNAGESPSVFRKTEELKIS